MLYLPVLLSTLFSPLSVLLLLHQLLSLYILLHFLIHHQVCLSTFLPDGTHSTLLLVNLILLAVVVKDEAPPDHPEPVSTPFWKPHNNPQHTFFSFHHFVLWSSSFCCPFHLPFHLPHQQSSYTSLSYTVWLHAHSLLLCRYWFLSGYIVDIRRSLLVFSPLL